MSNKFFLPVTANDLKVIRNLATVYDNLKDNPLVSSYISETNHYVYGGEVTDLLHNLNTTIKGLKAVNAFSRDELDIFDEYYFEDNDSADNTVERLEESLKDRTETLNKALKKIIELSEQLKKAEENTIGFSIWVSDYIEDGVYYPPKLIAKKIEAETFHKAVAKFALENKPFQRFLDLKTMTYCGNAIYPEKPSNYCNDGGA